MGEKGHVKPATYLDSHEKFLIGVATKGGNGFLFSYLVQDFLFLKIYFNFFY